MPNETTHRQALYRLIAHCLIAVGNCQRTGNHEWEVIHHERIERFVSRYLPSGGGFDAGTSLDFEKSRPDRLVFSTSFHHMNDHGYYDGWTEHQVIVTPSLAYGFELRITGRNRGDIKELIEQTFDHHLTRNYSLYTEEAA